MPNSKKTKPAAKHPAHSTAKHPAPARKPIPAKAPSPARKPDPAKAPAPAKKPVEHAKTAHAPSASDHRPHPKEKAHPPARNGAVDKPVSNGNGKAPHAPAKAAPKAAAPADKATAKADTLRARILERRSAKPIAFTLDEVREIAKTNVGRPGDAGGDPKSANGKAKLTAAEIEAKLKKSAPQHHVKPASLADILGYNPVKQSAPNVVAIEDIDPKFQRYYKLLLELREHVQSGLNTHTEETLKRSAKEDSGDLSGYAQHMADAGTDTFDRDFALSLVSNEQEALAEIDAAIVRIQKGTYGVCELTGKPITKERLLAVPFARYSVESQAEVERTKRRSANRAGLFGETGEETGKAEDDGGGGDE